MHIASGASAPEMQVGGPDDRGAVDPATRARLRAIVLTQLEARRHSALALAWQEMRQLDVYANLSDPAADEVLASVGWVFATLSDCMARDRFLTPSEIARLEEIGASRARRGIPLHLVKQAFSAGVRHSSAALAAIGEELAGDGVSAVIPGMLADLVLLVAHTSAAIEHGFTRQGGRHSPREARRFAGFVEAVLGATPSLRLDTMAAELGISGRGSWTLVLAVPRAGASTDLHAVVDDVSARLTRALEGPSNQLPWPHAVLLLADVLGPPDLSVLEDVARRHTVSFAVDSGQCWTALGARFHRLRSYLHVVGLVGRGPGVVSVGDLLAHEPLLMTPLDTAEAVIRDALGPVLALPPDEARAWLELLEVLYEAGGAVRAAAQALHMHEGTLRKRLGRMPGGLDPRRAQDRFRISQACHLLRLHGAALPPIGDPRWS